MPPSRKAEAALMGMMERFLESNATCECPDCRKSTKKLKKFTASTPRKDNENENVSPSRPSSSAAELDRHLCAEHRSTLPLKKAASKDKDKAVSNATPLNRADKVNMLLKADSVQDVLEVFKTTPSTNEENQLANNLQKVVAQVKTYPESKAKIMEYCNEDTIDLDAVFGLLAKFRQERSILTTALITSNGDRETSNMEREKYLQAIHEVNDLMYMLRDVAKEGKGPGGDEMRHSLGNMIFKIHELAKHPSSLYEELMDLRDEYDDQMDRFRDVESCHEKLHEDKKRLQDDIAFEKREHLETRRKLSALQGTKNEVNQAHKSLDKVHGENLELKKEIDKLNAELAKINALKHENTQLKKKLAAAEAAKAELVAQEKPAETAQSSKKKKGKKGVLTAAGEGTDSAVIIPVPEVVYRPDPAQEKELKALQQSKSEIQSQLDSAQTRLRQLESSLKKADVAKTKALEKQQLDQATAENWKELSEGHQEESNRLREQLDESMSHATTLQNTVHRLEQSLAETKEQLQAYMHKRAASPSMQSQTSATSRFDNDSFRVLRKLRGETAQLVQDLDTARNYPGDPWNLVECTRNMVAAIDHDLEAMLLPQREPETPNPIPDTYLPLFPRSDLGIQAPISLPRAREATPPLSTIRSQSSVLAQRPLLPPGLSEPSLGRSSPKPHLPSPIGTGRPTRNTSGLTPSPTQPSARIASTGPVSTAHAGVETLGNGVAGVDWSIWTRR